MFSKFCTVYKLLVCKVSALLFLSWRGGSDAFSVGVPQLRSTCLSMTPQHHHYPPQVTQPPFIVLVNRDVVSGGAQLFVTLMSSRRGSDVELDNHDVVHFKGFYMQMRQIEDDKPVGVWVGDGNGKVHSCGGKRANAVYHASGKVKKENVTLIWKAPKNYDGEVVVTATVVKDFVTYWTFVESNPIRIVRPTKRISNPYFGWRNQSNILTSKYNPYSKEVKSQIGENSLNDDDRIRNNYPTTQSVCDKHVLLVKRLFCILFQPYNY